MKIFKKKPNPCEKCKCSECDQNCNPNISEISANERVAENIMYEEFGCLYGVKKKKKEKALS